MNHPLRLAVGSHEAGSGKGCAMNVISWENGDTTITDFPDCADGMLAVLVQRVNDSICTHRDGDLLCADCSIQVLDLGHRVVGTGDSLGLSDRDRQVVWVRIAVSQARGVAHLNADPRVMAAVEAAEGWRDGTVTSHAAYAAANAARAALAAGYAANTAAYAAAYAANTAAYAAYAGYTAANAAAAYAAGYAADAAYTAANAAGRPLIDVANEVIDQFYELTGATSTPVSPATASAAIERMLAVH